MIWKTRPSLDEINRRSDKTMHAHLGIRFVEIGDDYVKATMPVDGRTVQPAGILHGGALVTLAEGIGSVGANLTTEEDVMCVGIDINSNHIAATRSGLVTGIGRPWHLGKKTQVWHIEIHNEKRLVNISRLTIFITKNYSG